MDRPSYDCIAKDQRSLHCTLINVLFQTEWSQQVRVQANQVGDQFESVGGSVGS